MYQSEAGLSPALHAPLRGARTMARVRTAVYFLGLTSLLTDISAEMVASVLPVYLFTVLRLSPLEFGLIDGLYNGTTAIVRLLAGYLSDRTREHKTIAFIGYFLSALSKAGLLVAGFAGWASVAAVLLVDRIGKGIRTSPRDALIAQHAGADMLGAAFGVHRAMDAVGAIVGPLLATGILIWLPKRFDYVFVTSLCFAVFGLLVLGTCVKPARAHAGASAQQLLPATPVTLWATALALRSPRFLMLAGASMVLSLFTLTDNMIYVGLQRRLAFEASYLPLLFVATAAVFMCLAIPMGRLADRVGHLRVFLFGYLLLAVVYCAFALLPPHGVFDIVVYVGLIGAYYAATDGIVSVLAVKQLPDRARTTGIACIATLISIGRMGSSILFGWLWQTSGLPHAVGLFGIGMLVALGITIGVAAWVRKCTAFHTE